MQFNKVHHIDFLNNKLPDKSVQLIIADPPYFETKGEFDFIWASFSDYLIDVEKWAIECKRILAENGTLFWFGSSKKIAYSQIIFDKYFGLINNLVWEKAEADGMFGSTGSEQLRSFPNSTERILMYCKGSEPNKNAFESIMSYIKTERIKTGWNYSDMDNYLNIKASSCFWDKETSHEYVIPTKQNWDKLQTTGNFQKPYEELRKEYEELRRPFENFTKSTEVLKVRFKPSELDHDTVKPEKLARILIKTCSRKNDLVVIPFSGSGTEIAMAIKEGRRAIGFEITKEYIEITNRRIKDLLMKPELFSYD